MKEEEILPNKTSGFLNLYYQSIKSVPILKYSRIFIATIIILALTAFFKLKNSDVFYYAIAVILISFLGFLFSFMLNAKDPVIKRLLYLLITCIVLTMGAATLGFGTYIFFQKPDFYKRLFPDKSIIDTTLKKIVYTDTTVKAIPKANTTETVSKKQNNEPGIKAVKPNNRVVSIQLSQESQGYKEILLDGNRMSVLPESTKFNPRIRVDDYSGRGELLILTKNGDTCLTYIPREINSDLFRVVPNCN